jgi:hypothetical protein
MPLLTRVFVKTAIVYFVLALVLGIVMTDGSGSGVFPVYIHLLVVGWLTQLIFGVIYWMFPKYSKRQPRGHESLAWVTYGTLNLGLVVRAIAEPLHALQASDASNVLLIVSAVLQGVSGLAFVANTWPRIREK